MRFRLGRKAVSIGFVASVALGGLVVVPSTVAHAASFVNPPERLYVALEDTDFLILPPYPFPNVPKGVLVFDGSTDPISQDVRTIEVDTEDGDAGCDLVDDPDVGDPDYDIDDCSRVVVDVIHGRITMGAVSTDTFRDDPAGNPNPADPAYLYSTGAILDGFGGGDSDTDPNDPGGFTHLEINGTEQQLNDTLANLVYTPDADYHYTDSDPEERLFVSVVPGNSDDVLPPDPPPPPGIQDSATWSVEVRVLDVNNWPTHDGPDTKSADPELELVITDEFTAADEDNDEDVDGDQADPPEQEEPLKDGEFSQMLLVGWLTCGQPIDSGTGFHFGSSIFELDDATLDDLLTDILAPAGADPTYLQGALALLEGIKPGITTIPLATSEPTTYTTAFGGISTMGEVLDALSEVTFLHNRENDTCELLTIVSDLGNNGLPVQYVGSPPDGVEVPFIGFDWNVLTITTGELEELDISFDAEPLYVLEGDPGDPGDVPIAEAAMHIAPGTHPPFTIGWEADPRVGDPVLAGQAEANVDFSGTFNNSPVIPLDAATVTASVDLALSLPDETVFRDDIAEGNETFVYRILPDAFDAPDGFDIVSSVPERTVVIIDDDDAARTLTGVSNPTVTEGDSGTTNMTFTLTLDGPADGNETVDVDTADDSATDADNDYEPLADTVTFAPGATTATVTVVVNGDTADEPNETLTLQLSNPSSVTLGDASGTGTITNDDDPRTVTAISAPATPEGNPPSTPTMPFTITLDNPAKAGDTVHVTTSGATENVDYTDIDQVVALDPGQLTTTVNVTLIGDTTIEGDEIVTLSLDSPSSGVVLGVSSGTGTIVNDDGLPAASITDVTVTEGDAGTVTATFTVSLSDPAVGGEQITAATADGSAVSPADFAAVGSQVITFAPGATTGTVNVTINGDTDPEADQSFTVVLSAPSQLTIADGSGTGTILNDDILVTFAPTATITEGDSGSVALAILPATHPAFDVVIDTTDGTANAPADYDALIGEVVTVPANATTFDVFFNTQEDGLFEGDQTFTADVAPGPQPLGFTVRTAPATDTAAITILDDDPQPIVSVAGVTVVEGATAAVPLTLGNLNHTCVANYATTEVSATEPEDFAAASGQATLPPSTTIDVVTVDDSDVEVAHTFTVTITLDSSSDPACVLGTAMATVTIVDNDDPSPTLSIADASVAEGTGPGSTTISFTVTTSGVQPADCGYRITLTHATTDDGDFTAPATFDLVDTFTTGDVSVARDFGVTRDGADEPDETFTVTIAGNGATPCAIGDGVAGGTINDDDLPAADTTDPDVTVTPVGPNPTSVTPIDFTVQFTEPVTGFDAADVMLGGTAGASGISVSAIDADTYTVTVTTVPATGTVTVSVPADSAVDGAGNGNTPSNTASVQFNLPAVDNQPPTVSVIAVGSSPTTASPVDFTIQFTEPVTGLTLPDLVVTGPAGFTPSLVPVDADTYTVSVQGMTAAGNITVTVPADSAQDAALNGNTASNTAVVEFQLAPGPLTLNLPSNIVRNSDPGQAGAVVTFSATASGGAPPVVVTCAPASGALFAIGTTTVSCTATDAEEGVQEAIVSGTFTVQVIDVEPPVIADLPDLTRTTTGTTPVVVTFPLPAASDNSGVAPTVVCSPASGSSFQVGTSTVTCTATDGAGLTASSSFTVTVTSNPIQPPTPTPTPLPPTGGSPAGILFLASALVALGALLGATRKRQQSGVRYRDGGV